jgi:hypothetical protein
VACRLLTPAALLLQILLSHCVWAEVSVDASVELLAVAGGELPGFHEGSQGKLRYGTDDDGLQLSSSYMQFEGDLDAVWHGKLGLHLNPQADRNKLGVIDAYLQYRPLPRAGVRARVKVGAFRPPLSFEHGPSGWETLYTTNASAINSWVGEELGLLGAEVSLKRDLASARSPFYWAVAVSGFYGNDTSGTLLSWRGWSVNNWQTPWGGVVALAPLPVIGAVPGQDQRIEPFLELDNEPGYYAWVELGHASRLRLRYLRYDNRADPLVRAQGQAGWRTIFDSLSLQVALPGQVGLVAQWLDGVTYAGPKLWGGRHAIDNGYDSQFLLVTRTVGAHRFSVRHDWFSVTDRDFNPIDPNDENGTGWTLSYQYRVDTNWLLGLEWLRLDSERPARVFEGAPERLVEEGVFAVVRWHL